MKTKSFVIWLTAATLLGCVSSRSPDSIFPQPTGEHRVATRILSPLVDESRPDDRFESGSRTLPVQIWYPTDATAGDHSLYFVDPALVDTIKAESSVPDRVETWRLLRTHSIEDGPIANGTFPLVLFSHGFGMARAYYTSWIEELVSHGFIVASIDHPFSGLTRIDEKVFGLDQDPDGPEGKTAVMARDLSFLLPTLSRLPGVDADRIAAIGHSIGGAAALELCRLDDRLAGCVNFDGAPFGEFASTGVEKPYMVVHQQPNFPDAKPDGELALMGREIEKEWQEILSKQSEPVHRLSVRGTGHFSFSDALFIRPELIEDSVGEISDPIEVLTQTSAVVVQFLENLFSGKADAELSLPELITPARLGEVGS